MKNKVLKELLRRLKKFRDQGYIITWDNEEVDGEITFSKWPIRLGCIYFYVDDYETTDEVISEFKDRIKVIIKAKESDKL